ncbi:hypothetical protein IID24_03325 [Patescibacteria group bacterium]|nr:hypothetical protein [Patescibacteria group bacterium]
MSEEKPIFIIFLRPFWNEEVILKDGGKITIANDTNRSIKATIEQYSRDPKNRKV